MSGKIPVVLITPDDGHLEHAAIMGASRFRNVKDVFDFSVIYDIEECAALSRRTGALTKVLFIVAADGLAIASIRDIKSTAHSACVIVTGAREKPDKFSSLVYEHDSIVYAQINDRKKMADNVRSMGMALREAADLFLPDLYLAKLGVRKTVPTLG